jgi:DNA-binding transcriptional LysR family regulator
MSRSFTALEQVDNQQSPHRVRKGLTWLVMELRQLRYFVAVAEERHFGRAAARLQIATPTLSQQLRTLERTLGVMLLDRTHPRTVTLTSGGDLLLRHARVLLSRADRARDEVRAAADEPEQIMLRVAPGAELLLGPQLRRLTDDDSLGIITVTSSTGDALRAVREEGGDAAIVWDGRGDRQGLRTVVLQDVVIHLAVPAAHPLADLVSVDVADLALESIVLFPRTLAPNDWDAMHHHLLPNGTSRPDQIITESNATTGPSAVLRSVAAGKGVAPTVARLAQHSREEGVVLLPLVPPLTLPLELAWREPAGDTLQRVIAFLQLACRPTPTLQT